MLSILVIKVLLIDIERSRIEIRNQRLVQRVAMLEDGFEEITKTSRERTLQFPRQSHQHWVKPVIPEFVIFGHLR